MNNEEFAELIRQLAAGSNVTVSEQQLMELRGLLERLRQDPTLVPQNAGNLDALSLRLLWSLLANSAEIAVAGIVASNLYEIRARNSNVSASGNISGREAIERDQEDSEDAGDDEPY
ncbi:hypothetical protein ACC668_02795 [Rhizobium ruizarguesonis]